MQFRNPIQLLILAIIISSVGTYHAFAIDEGGRCEMIKYGNSKVMSNGKPLGMFDSNANYAGPIYLCSGGTWMYWETVQPKPKSQSKSSLVDVAPGQFCKSLGKKVSSKNFGKLRCMYFRVGKMQTLMWVRA
jgi:hypothetical protein